VTEVGYEGKAAMRPNPISDAIQFLTGSALFYIFILLVLIGLIVAAVNLARDPGQRNLKGEITAEGHGFRAQLRCIWHA
jgi:hypothetical protein